jgi:hypothetical protein
VTNNDKLTTTSEAEISKRLDDIFGDDESFDNSENTQFESSPNTNNIKQNVYSKDSKVMNKSNKDQIKISSNNVNIIEDKSVSIDGLKAIILEMDWEISDENIDKFLFEIRKLKQAYKKDKELTLLLKLHDSMGKYIKSKKSQANPDSIKFIQSGFEVIEKILASSNLNKIEKKKMILTEVKKFKKLKENLYCKLNDTVSSSNDSITFIIENAKKSILTELRLLKDDLKLSSTNRRLR